MLQVQNETPFTAALFLLPDPAGVDTLYVAIKATFEIGARAIRVAAEQQPIVPGDEYRGDPETTSLRHAGEAHPCKPATDVVLLGSGHAPEGRPAPHFGVSLTVGRLEKLIHVYGDRVWKSGLMGLVPSSPVPTAEVPLVWERAYGGTVDLGEGETVSDQRNPVGVGFRGGRSAAQMKGLPVPNLDDPRDPLVSLSGSPAPAGFGFIGPAWLPRPKYAGTYDDEWERNRAPFLPDDFDPRFLQAAPPDQIYPGSLQGGEPVRIQNGSPVGIQQFALPVCELVAVAWKAGKAEPAPLRIESLILEPDQDRFSLLWRGAVPCDKQALQVEQVAVSIRSMQGVSS